MGLSRIIWANMYCGTAKGSLYSQSIKDAFDIISTKITKWYWDWFNPFRLTNCHSRMIYLSEQGSAQRLRNQLCCSLELEIISNKYNAVKYKVVIRSFLIIKSILYLYCFGAPIKNHLDCMDQQFTLQNLLLYSNWQKINWLYTSVHDSAVGFATNAALKPSIQW